MGTVPHILPARSAFRHKVIRHPFARLASLLCFAWWATVFGAVAQYSIDWSTIDGGGGTSTGGVYSLSGTIGQPDAGSMSGGSYTLTGGFWSIVAAVQTPGAPLLRILRTATNTVVVAWPNPSTGFILQQNSDLNSSGWTEVSTPPVVVGDEKQLIVSPPAGSRFYRLQKP